MRGRTNIVQRTGPSVIGTLVTQKQVTGNKINVGDFVQFTGDTSSETTLIPQSSFNYSSKFRISDSIFGCALYNVSGNQLRIIIYNKDGILSNVLFSISPSFNPRSSTSKNLSFNSFYYNSNIYITFGVLYGTSSSLSESVDLTGNFIYVFSYSNSQITFNKIISVEDIKDNYEGRLDYISNFLAPIVLANKIYCIMHGKYGSTEIVELDIDGNYISIYNPSSFRGFDLSSSTSGSSSNIYNYGISVSITSDYIIITGNVDDSTTRAYILINISTGLFYENGNGVAFGRDSEIIKVGELYFCFGTYSTNAYKGPLDCLVVFKIINNTISILTDYNSFLGSGLGSVSFSLILVKTFGNEYHLFCFEGRDTNYQRKLNYVVYNDNSQTIELINSLELSISSSTDNIDLSDIMNIDSDSFLLTYGIKGSGILIKRRKFSLDEIIEWIEGYDLVKKYSDRIDGVAKSEGSAGQTISVYVP